MDDHSDGKKNQIIPLFSTVRLKDGREGAIIDIYRAPELVYEIDFTFADSEEIITEIIAPNLIETVVHIGA